MFYGWEKVERSQVLWLLIKVRLLFCIPTNWIFWPIAVDSNGNEIDPRNEYAVKWSLMGACDLYSDKFEKPLSDFVSCATREYLNDLSEDDLIHGRLSYDEEFALINLAIDDLEKEDV